MISIKIRVYVIILIILCSAFTASADFKNELPKLNLNKEWTFMFYVDVDYWHNWWDPTLLGFVKQARPGENLNIVILQDTVYGPGKIWQINENGRKILMEKLGEVNVGNYTTLKYFITYCKNNFPAERYFIDFAGHGCAWYGVCLDETNNNSWKKTDNIQKALTETGGVDIISYTGSCAMSAFESVYELRDLVDVYIGCQEGTVYDHRIVGPICQLLNDEISLSNVEIGNRIIEIVKETEKNNPNSPFARTTISATRTDTITDLINATGNLSQILLDNLDEYYNDIKSVHQNTQLFFDKDLIDIYDFAKKLF